MLERKNIDPTGYLRQQEEAEERWYSCDEPPKKNNYIDKDDILGLRKGVEAKGFHIATNNELAWLRKPMTEHDKRLVAWAKMLSYTEWMKIKPEEADTYQGWQALDDISRRLYHDEGWSAGG